MSPLPFWTPTSLNPPALESTIAAAEMRLGVTLPAAFVALMRQHDGGYALHNDYRDPQTGEVWELVFIDGVHPLDRLETLAATFDDVDFGDGGSAAEAATEAGTSLLVPFSEHGFRTYSCFDYRDSGPHGEPAVVLLVMEVDGPVIKRRVADFPTLLAGLFTYEPPAVGPP